MSRSRLVFFVIIGGALLIVVFVALINPQIQANTITQSTTATAQYIKDNITTIRVVYGTEKERWFRDAVQRFETANPDIQIVLDGEGSVDAYQGLSQLRDDSTTVKIGSQTNPIPAVWSPAATIEVNMLNSDSQTALNRKLAASCKPLVLSPLVIMAWEDRAKVFDAYYKDKGGITFQNIYDALHDPKINGKWDAIGGKSSWGYIKIGHTQPQKSNSGIMTLLAMANNFYAQTKMVSVADITDPKFIDFMNTIEKGVTQTLIDSSGTFVNDVIVRGPSSYDFVIAYEALGIEHFREAMGKQGQSLRIIYPEYNLYSDHPLCLIDHPAITQRQKDAAVKFQTFLLSPDIQRLAATYGFRPADPSIPTFGAGTDFDSPDLKAGGLSAAIGQEFQIPDGNTIIQLLDVWRRNFPNL